LDVEAPVDRAGVVEAHMKLMRQLSSAAAFGVRSLPQRVGSCIVVVVCVAIVVMVMLGVLSLSHSLERAIGSSSRLDRAILLSEGAELEDASAIPRTALAPIEQLRGIRRNAEGKAVLSAEVLMFLPLRERKADARASVLVRGVGPGAGDLRPEVVIAEGHMLRTGLNELVVGREARRRFKGLDIGAIVKLRNVPFAIVGIFETDGDVRESEVIADAQALISIRPTARYQSVTVQLDSPDLMNKFKAAVEQNPSIGVDVFSEPEYSARQTTEVAALLELVAYLVGSIMAAAASFSAANTLYTTVSTRRTEIATLRAIGFGSLSVMVAIVVESLVLALIGAAIGSVLTAIVINGQEFDSQTITTRLDIDSTLIAIGTAWACGIAVVSAFAPAIHAARMPIAKALREV
jgi:putative ABC transport system permease protein